MAEFFVGMATCWLGFGIAALVMRYQDRQYPKRMREERIAELQEQKLAAEVEKLRMEGEHDRLWAAKDRMDLAIKRFDNRAKLSAIRDLEQGGRGRTAKS